MHEDDIPSYNVSVRALLVELKIKLGEEKEEAHKASKLTGDWGNQGVCSDKLVNKLTMHA